MRRAWAICFSLIFYPLLAVYTAAALAGLSLALGVASGPHHLNAGQFAWPALFRLSFELGLALETWWKARRFVLAAAALLLAFVSPA